MTMTEKNKNTIKKNRLEIEQQLQDLESQIASLRSKFELDEFETYMGHTANNMMLRVMELGSLIATNRALIKGAK